MNLIQNKSKFRNEDPQCEKADLNKKSILNSIFSKYLVLSKSRDLELIKHFVLLRIRQRRSCFQKHHPAY